MWVLLLAVTVFFRISGEKKNAAWDRFFFLSTAWQHRQILSSMRARNELRNVSIQRNTLTNAPGSVLISTGNTRVLCTASISTDLPGWMLKREDPRGWITAEYNMLPASTTPRRGRKADGRSTEIQRLIARSLRAAVDLHALPGLIIHCDCEVLNADGGTRTASITGSYIALVDAIEFALKNDLLKKDPILGPVAAVSVGIIDGEVFLDLDYGLDSRAEVDLNVAMNHRREFVEIQGTGELGTFSKARLDELLAMAETGIEQLMKIQKESLRPSP